MGAHRYMVSFEGNGYTSASTVQMYTARRAQELCSAEGSSTFRILDRGNNTDTAFSANSYGANTVTRHDAIMMIECVKGAE